KNVSFFRIIEPSREPHAAILRVRSQRQRLIERHRCRGDAAADRRDQVAFPTQPFNLPYAERHQRREQNRRDEARYQQRTKCDPHHSVSRPSPARWRYCRISSAALITRRKKIVRTAIAGVQRRTWTQRGGDQVNST